jgi:UDP-galactopyranose mutase
MLADRLHGYIACTMPAMTILKRTSDLLVFSHLRWDFVFQRPQHLLTRCAQARRVYFVEEPLFEYDRLPELEISMRNGVHVCLPRLRAGTNEHEATAHLRQLVDTLVQRQISGRFMAWYYTPMALKFTRHLKPWAVVYDCMDELSNFKNAPAEIGALEDELFQMADVVFTGGINLYEYKRQKHHNVHPFPSSVDVAHFGMARNVRVDPGDQAPIPRPRIGYMGVIDERLDLQLIHDIAIARPQWQLVMIGPVTKIDPGILPRLPNIHYLGPRQYTELPAYLAGWDIGILPFARNDATRFISPTKTPEYLAAGRRVVSTSIRDVVRTYGDRGLAKIADDAGTCIGAIERSLAEIAADDGRWLAAVDEFLKGMSWDRTYTAMWQLIETAAEQRARAPALRTSVPRGALVPAAHSPSLAPGGVRARPPA